jgi:hypothetical protein
VVDVSTLTVQAQQQELSTFRRVDEQVCCGVAAGTRRQCPARVADGQRANDRWKQHTLLCGDMRLSPGRALLLQLHALMTA